MEVEEQVLAWNTLQNFINGQFVPAKDGETLDNIYPATSQVAGTIPRSKSQDVEVAVSSAKDALHLGPWGKTSVNERADLLEAIAQEIEDNFELFAYLESRDTGKPLSLTRRVDIPRAISNFRFFAGAVRHSRDDFHPMSDAFNYTLRRPVGVVGLITPWNLPLYLLSWKVAPALAMGNTIVAKPSELTPSTATLLADVISRVGVPQGVFQLVHGLGAEVGQAIVEHPDISAISFTGGTVTGKRVAATAAPQFKKLSLELGGKNPNIIFADCDFEKAVEGTMRASFTNQGQVCLCDSRVLVQREIFDAFTEAIVEKTKALVLGDPMDPQTEVGALVSVDHLEKVKGYVELAKEEGGDVLCGGERPEMPGVFADGAFLLPTIISGLTPQCRTVQEEIFGPVITLHPFDTVEEALEIANGVRYGLAASVWTQDLQKAHRVSAALETGMVWVNTWLHRDLRVPFGGLKDSGVGREGGAYSLSFFSEARNICIHMGEHWNNIGS